MKYLSILVIFLSFCLNAQDKNENINKEIAKGNFKKAEILINQKLSSGSLSAVETANLEYLKDRMNRVRLDFKKTEKDIKTALVKYYPKLSEGQIQKWEKEKSLEVMVIDGEKRYFNNAVPNLFRINKGAKETRIAKDGPIQDDLKDFLKTYLPKTVSYINKESKLGSSFTVTLKYTVTLKKDAVPEGEIVRCWLPYPREDHERQSNVRMLNLNSDEYVLTSDKKTQRTIYLEKKTVKNEPTIFHVEYQYTSRPQLWGMNDNEIKPYKKEDDFYKQYTKEEYPHIVFTKEIKELAEKIRGNETNPYKIVVKIVDWITNNIPWASAREYSTLDNIPQYCVNNMHGDCGIKSLLFITLSRYCGIPAKWQSGWMLHPGNVNLHDWAQVFYEGVGWVIVDPDFGIQKSDDLAVRNFYTNGIDAYRLVVNDGISDQLFPVKYFPRSEPVDFQRGELEWRGGNLYFDKWDYHMDVDISK
ncbi:MAG: transglutaminase domain-containing protein [Bacteroidota bacterium]|nr:transglutaminase domain-containing protein [Bacteroidota bacterium]